LNFSFYEDSQDPNRGSIVTEDQIRARMEIIAPYTNWIRTFGSTMGLEHSARIAREFNLNTAIGAWLDKDTVANESEMQNLITAALKGYVDIAIVGSEVLLRGDLSEDDLIDYIYDFKNAVQDVTVTTACVYNELLQHPKVIEACDIIFVNYYTYWEGKHIDDAIGYLHSIHQEVVAKSEGKELIVSETGWPSDGDQIGDASPTLENACYYFLNFISWARAEGVGYFYFEAFDETWKASYEGPQGAHWGVWYKDGVLKPCMQDVFDGNTVPDNWSGEGNPGGPGDPTIEFTFVPAYGSFDNLKGKVLHVRPDDYRVAVYIKVGNGWWTKPYWNNPLTRINRDGSWTCDITTGGIDHRATVIVAYLVRADYDPPLGRGGALPAELDQNSVAKVEATRSP
jgi:exo-beta-1,3-glucanase (GH17 family)